MTRDRDWEWDWYLVAVWACIIGGSLLLWATMLAVIAWALLASVLPVV